MKENASLTWYAIINPVAGKNKAKNLWKKLQPLLQKANIPCNGLITQYADHAIDLTKDAISRGAENFLIIGGDGTANEVINGIFTSEATPANMTVAMLSAGTGNDWVRTIGTYKTLEDIPAKLLLKKTMLHDVGLLEFKKNEATQKRYFINIAGLGFDGFTAKKIAEGNRLLQGTKLQYWLALLGSLFTYKHTIVKFVVDGKEISLNTLSAAIGNCKYNGGGMKQLPDAQFDDGFLDVTVIGNMSKLKMVVSLPKLTDGSFVTMNEITTMKGKEIFINSEKTIYVEADGEYLGTLPAKFSVLEKGISVISWK
ncbi:MAG: diacylglycerol/lipid kinase family protein [Chitinophagales bacterium]